MDEASSAGPSAQEPFSILCVSSQDWHVPLQTNRQQIMRRAAARGHEVLFLETANFLPRQLFRLLTAERGASLAHRIFALERVEPGVAVRRSVNLLPLGQKFDISRRANTATTAIALRRLAATLPRPLVLWLYDPAWAGLIGRLGEDFAVYDCVDDYTEQAGPDARRRALVEAGNRHAASRSRLVFATTESLRARLEPLNAATHLVPNGADYAHFAAAVGGYSAETELTGLRRPILGFAGNMLPLKVDFELVDGLAEARPDWSVALIGPAEGEALAALSRLASRPNIRWLGPKTYQELPRYVGSFDVGLIPYRRNRYTEACFPLKLYEYLAAGKPVVASGLPSLQGVDRDVLLADGVEELAAAVETALGRSSRQERERRMTVAERNTWDSRTSRLLELVTAELAR
jgi:glycosyltransferase involved in cell wall biosynthesis